MEKKVANTEAKTPEEIYEENGIDYLPDFKEDYKIPKVKDLNRYYFIETLSVFSKTDRQRILRKRKQTHLKNNI